MHVLFVSSRPRERRTMREGYQIYRTKETVNVLIPCTLIKRILSVGANVTITIWAVPEPSPSPKPVSRSSSTWSTVEEKDSPPSYQDVLAWRFDSIPVDQDMPPLETDIDPSYEPPEPLYEPEPRRPNIFTDNGTSNNPVAERKAFCELLPFLLEGEDR